MTRLRSLLLARHWLALAIVVAALAVRLAVPAGMMPGFGPGGATLIVCPGQMAMAGMAMPATDTSGRAMPAKEASGMAMPAGDAGKGGADRADAPCPFTDLLAAAIDGPALPVLPAMPLPVAVLAVAAAVAIARRTRRLRPPLRGPPAPFAA